MKKIMILCCFWVAGCFADDHLHSSASDTGVIFHATFDGQTDALKALGNPTGVIGGNGANRFAAGIRNQGLRIGLSSDRKESYSLSFEANKNLNPKRGTVCFWIKPENWNANDRDFRVWFSARAPKHDFFLYKYNVPEIFSYFTDEKKISLAKNGIGDWKQGEWHHVAVSWNEQMQNLYIDGELKSSARKKGAAPESYSRLILGTLGWEVEKGLSILDELKIFDRPLEAHEIVREIRPFSSLLKNRTAPLNIMIGSSSPKIDGIIQPGEYAVAGTGFLNVGGRYAFRQSRYFLSHDAEYLYIAVASPQTAAPAANRKERDGDLWLDDSIEIWIAGKNRLYQLIFNTDGVLYDAQVSGDRNARWNLKNYRVANRVQGGIWSAEYAIPLKELGEFPPEKINIARSFRSEYPQSATCIAPVRKELGFADVANYAAIELNKNAAHYAVDSIGNVNSGTLDLQIKSSAGGMVMFAADETVWLKETFREKLSLKKQCSQNGTLTIQVADLFRAVYRAHDSTPVAVDYIYTDIPAQTLRAVLRNVGGQNGGFVKMLLKEKNGAGVREQKSPVRGDQIFWTADWNLTDLPPGDYDFEAVYVDGDGRESGERFCQYFRKPQKVTAWENNTIGIYPGEVPPPWSPLKCAGDTVSAKMQTYSFRRSILPSAFVANGHEILSRPCVIRINGQTLENAVVKCLDSKPDIVTFRASGTVDGIAVTADIRVEYDGMIWFQIRLGAAAREIRSMNIDIPLKPEFAEQVHSCAGDTHRAKFGATGLVPADGWHRNLYSKPAFWVGNDFAGIAWYAETLKGWHNRKKDDSVEILPGKTESVVRLNVIDSSILLRGERRIEFGLHGTPVKEPSSEIRPNRMNKEWRWGLRGNYYFNYMDSGKEFFDRKGYDQITAPLRNGQANRFFLYLGSNGASPYAPEWGWFGKLWTSRPIGDYIIEYNIRNQAERNRFVWTYSCLNSKSFRDFYLWQLSNVLKDPARNVRNLYYDLVGPRMCDNAEHGCGWKDDDGMLWATHNISGGREFHKRLYHFMKKLHPESLHLYHVTGQPVVPAVHSFCDAVVEGETFFGNEVVEKETYFGVLTPPMFRVAYYGQKWGYPTIFIPQLNRSAMFHRRDRVKLWTAANPPPAMLLAYRHFIGYALVHDVSLWTECITDTNLLQGYWDAIRKFFGEWDTLVRFVPYWSPEKKFTVSSKSPERVIASAYLRKEKAMLVILNDTATPRNVSISYPGFTTVERIDAPAEKMTKGAFQDTIPAQSFKLYFLK